MTPGRVALVGVHGHGRWHLGNISRLAAAGRARLVAVCDRAPVHDPRLDPSHVYTELSAMLDETRPDVVVLATPPATHRAMAIETMVAGADVLVEKPPAVRLADLDAMVGAAERFGRLCQVGFQSLGSPALARLRDLARRDGIEAVTAAGAWNRPHSYFQRAPWAGRRFAGGIPVGDGALTNPFGHALMNALEIAGLTTPDGLSGLETELYHANDIESDDTSCLRIRQPDGPEVSVAVTLCADRVIEPRVCIGTRARWQYTTGELFIDGTGVELPSPPDLLENLLLARAGHAGLISPLRRSRAYTAASEWLLNHAAPRPIDARYRVDDPDLGTIVPGVADVVAGAARHRKLFSESGVVWAA